MLATVNIYQTVDTENYISIPSKQGTQIRQNFKLIFFKNCFFFLKKQTRSISYILQAYTVQTYLYRKFNDSTPSISNFSIFLYRWEPGEISPSLAYMKTAQIATPKQLSQTWKGCIHSVFSKGYPSTVLLPHKTIQSPGKSKNISICLPSPFTFTCTGVNLADTHRHFSACLHWK